LINPQTIQTIIETARIEEVISEFVTLKKRGVNLLGLCPFHNEKTPSFTVSPSKGIYKCFGCGKAGNSVNFIMEHEHYTYPEALKFLAKKYFIEIEEREETQEEKEAVSEKESLFNLNSFAQKYFSENLTKSDEGKAIGLSYFKEREFKESTIEKFELGYCIDQWNNFTEHAIKNGYKSEYLEKTGLSIAKDQQLYDRFRGRVMFPIHNLSGRVIGYGGRILSSDKSKAKYVNSPESEIYHKSQVLYGLYFAKNAIISNDNCFLVEGYTDVISMFQAGVENVVSSSGTSLTIEQIKLIRRYSSNVTILYDGDAAGIKASFRGIDMVLEEGLNVKIVLFPDGEDPDSFARKKRPAELKDFITNEAHDFIKFKTKLLLEETKDDPVKKAGLIKEIVNSISLIPDNIIRSLYVKECSSILDISEQTLINELNKIRRKKFTKKTGIEDEEIPETTEYISEKQIEPEPESCEYQEKEVIRLLLSYGNQTIKVLAINDDNEEEELDTSIGAYIVNDLINDEITFEDPLFQLIFDEFKKEIDEGNNPDEAYFINHSNADVRKMAIDLISTPYTLSQNWEDKHKIAVKTEDINLKETINKCLNTLKLKKIEMMLSEILSTLKSCTDEEEILALLSRQQKYDIIKAKLSDPLGRIITK